MRKEPPNHGKPITNLVVNQVRDLANHNTPTGLIAYRTGRTENAVRSIASENNISLKPTNQSPYNRRKP